MKMSKANYESINAKAIREGCGIYDTKAYRYVLQDDGTMKRCKLENVGRTSALDADAWETVVCGR